MDEGTSAPPGGGSGYLFQRESWVGLSSGRFGEIRFGRQYSPYFMTFIMIDPTHMSLGGAIGNFCWPGDDSLLGGAFDASDTSRRDNAVIYTTPDLGGVKAEFMASGGEQTVNGRTISTRGNAYSIALQYASDSLLVRGSWMHDGLIPSDSLDDGRQHDQYFVLGATWNAGFAAPSLMLVKKISSSESIESPDIWTAQAAASIPAGRGAQQIFAGMSHSF